MPCKSYFTNFVLFDFHLADHTRHTYKGTARASLGSFYCRNTFDLSYVFNILYEYQICQQHLNTFGSSLDTKKSCNLVYDV